MLLRNYQMVVPVNRSIFSPENFTSSTRSPLDMNFPSHKSAKRYENGGVGLGIVAALEKPGVMINRNEISSKFNPVCYSNSASNPVYYARRLQIPADIDLSEEYTCVTSRDGMTRVYYNNGEECEFYHSGSGGGVQKSNKPVDIAEEIAAKEREALRDSQDFLSRCCLCKKKLQGKDIYMYKGDEGFCSKECRSVRIMEDDNYLNVKHKSTSVGALSPYAGRQISSAGIFVI